MKFPYEVNGWLTEAEGLCLAGYAEGKRVLEVGAYCGRSTVCMAQGALHVTSVDPFDARTEVEKRLTWPEYYDNVKRYGVLDKVTAVAAPSPGGVYALAGPFDFAFVDGAHDKASVMADIEAVLAKLVPGGLIAFHDYWSQHWNGVKDGIEAVLKTGGGQVVEVVETVAVIRPERRSSPDPERPDQGAE